VAQDRAAEKSFVEKLGGRPARWAAVDNRAALETAIEEIGVPAILKTTRMGYDGKGQARIMDRAERVNCLL
jgi:5-(carboxyamino)imidazole ribonucleotide synthase